MKQLNVIFFTLFVLITVFGGDRWGTSSSYSSGTVIGTSRTIGVDPENGLAIAYDANVLTNPQEASREGMALGYYKNGRYIFDLAQCEDSWFPQSADTLVFILSKSETRADGLKHGYYGTVTMLKDATFHIFDEP